ncbi:lipopolysaccharide biosynthesis protein [Persicitalea jodogahamensis]|uniref:Polysaccharide biosynthesis protein n=1 Tax=Persicitalea jodogahamensis TaxID=402147 RepID=A0A8J3D346_9BACT|nr:hypothetical protein [Persicitalea jodogahamensis]GHB62933.1 hypothetical protein GCM10007390_15960 [Persicitalea jodogahamensis]
MSSTNRIISGSAASWARIVITLISQLAFVPIYLTHWEVSTYGVWLAIQSMISILSTLDKGYQNYLGFEFLRCGRENILELRRFLWSGSLVGVLLGFVQIIVILLLFATGSLNLIFGGVNGIDTHTVRIAGYVLLSQSISWLISGSISSIMGRALAVYGYYPRMSWWGVVSSIVTTTSPIISVLLGYGLFVTGLVSAVVTLIYNIPLYIDMIRLLKKEKVYYIIPSLQLGWKTFVASLILSVKDLLENFRQQGVRLVLTPLVGAVGIATFSTIRTGSNVALQGLGTITNPLLPELMNFLHRRDQIKIDASFAAIWIVVIVLLAPGIVILQAIAPELYKIWVKNEIAYDPYLLATLSLGVLVYAQSQPAMAIIRGNNILRPQLFISIVAVSALFILLFILVPYLGLPGAGVALLISELVATQGYKIVAKRWLLNNGLKWPIKTSLISSFSILTAGIATICLSRFSDYVVPIVLISIIILLLNSIYFCMNLPKLILIKLRGMINK